MSLQPGASFAGFTIERMLGAGGMGTVYLAGHPRLNRRVALKVLADTFSADPKTRAAFDREATLAAGLDHPNIVSVYDRSAIDDPGMWLAMQYIDGGDAAGLLRDNPEGLAPERAVRLLADAADALDHAHEQGVLHRDVKPANLLIENNHRHGERAVLTDFGIARTLDDTVTLSGITATFAYAAPERFGYAPADHRADIYSLGCTLFQLLTGQPPFPRKDQASVIGAHLTAPPPAPRDLRPELPAELDAVIATAMAKSPQDRYPSCTALAEAAARALPPPPVPRQPDSPTPIVIPSGPTPDQAAVPTIVRAAKPPLPEQEDPHPSLSVAITTQPPGSARRRRFAALSGLFLAGVGVLVGAAFMVRDSGSPATTSGTTPTSAVVSQPVTSTTAPAPRIEVVVSAPPPVAETTPPTQAPPPPIDTVPVEQPRPPVTYPQQVYPTAQEAPAVVPRTRAHQFPG